MGVLLIVIGIVLVVASGKLTGSYMRKRLPLDGLSRHEQANMMEASAGTGVVPSWVSLLNLVGWAIGVIGLIVLFVA